MPRPTRIAILGGGLTGLASAFHLSRRFPSAQITLLEKKNRVGGWVRSERVNLPDERGSVLLEGGPRTLRPNGKSVLELINLLKLKDQVITVSKSAPPARSRFLYIPPSYLNSTSLQTNLIGLQRIPSSLISLVSSPLLPILLSAILREPFKGANRPSGIKDESVDSFLTRRFGENFARTFGSALIHGIYATDSRKLSVRAAFPGMWDAETRGWGSLIRGLIIPRTTKQAHEENYDLGGIEEMMQGVSVYSFRDGMETLTKSLEERLKKIRNVEILKRANVERLSIQGDQSIEIAHSGNQTLQASHVVSALSLPILHSLITGSVPLPHLTSNPSSTVRVVNFIFPSPPKDVHPEGFGYLIPRPPDGYPSVSTLDNTGVLGTVFDSCSLHAQDLPSVQNYYYEAPHTKLTMMTGGPYPLSPLPSQLISSESNGDIPVFVQNLLSQLRIQLRKPDLPSPIYWRIWNNENCIPILTPGHLERIEGLRKVLGLSAPIDSGRHVVENLKGFGGRFEVVGAGVGGVSVGDCLEAGRRVGRAW